MEKLWVEKKKPESNEKIDFGMFLSLFGIISSIGLFVLIPIYFLFTDKYEFLPMVLAWKSKSF